MESPAIDERSVWDLAEQGAYDDAIAKFKTIPEGERTVQDILGGATAMIGHESWDTPSRMAELREAISLLKSVEQKLEKPESCCHLYGIAYYQLGEYKTAAAYFQKDAEYKDALEVCRRILHRPKDKESFRSRVQKAWKAITPVEAELRRQINRAQSSPSAQDQMMKRINSLLCIAFRETGWTWNPGDKPMLELDPDKRCCVALAQQYFLDHAPKKVSAHWDLHVGDWAPSEEELADMIRAGNWLSDMDVAVESGHADLLKLVVYHPLLAPDKVTDEIQKTILEKITNHLGELMYISAFFTTEYRGDIPKCRTLKLGQLLPTLEAMGFGHRDDPNSILKRRRLYTAIPRDRTKDPGYCWRDDVFLGTSMDPALCLIYGHGSNDFYGPGHLVGSGAVPCFVVFPLQDQTDNPPALMRDLLKELDDAMDPETALVLGNAQGLQFGYLDLLAWDLQPALDTVKGLLRKHNLPWACWHSFFAEDRTVQLF